MEHVGNPSTWESSRPYLSKLKAEREMRGEGRGGEKKERRKGEREEKESSEKGMAKTKYQQPTMEGATHPDAHRAIQPDRFPDQTKTKS